MPKVPGWYKEQKKKYPEVFRAYEDLGEVCRKAGPLDGRTAALVKLAIAVGTRHEGAAHSPTSCPRSRVRRRQQPHASPEQSRELIPVVTWTGTGQIEAFPWRSVARSETSRLEAGGKKRILRPLVDMAQSAKRRD